MALTHFSDKKRYNAEKKRESRAKKSSAYRDRERELSRQRMAITRARNRAQKRASQLRSILNEEDKRVVEARADKERQRLICDWFSRNKSRLDPKGTNDNDILNSFTAKIDNDVLNNFMSKLDFHKIELQVAEFEIALMGVGDEGDNIEGKNLASGLDKSKGETLQKELCKIDSSEQHLNNQIDRFLGKEVTTSEKRTVLETTGVRETTGTPSTTGGDSGKDAFAASLLLGLIGAKDDKTAAIASVRGAPPAAVGDSGEGASRPDAVAATGNDDDGTAARHTVSPSLDTLDGPPAGAAPIAFLLPEGWRSAIDRGSGRVYVYRQLPGRRAPSNLGVGVLPPRRGAETSGDIGTCEANDASIPDSQMSSHA